MGINAFADFVADCQTKCPGLRQNQYYNTILENVGNKIIDGSLHKGNLASAKHLIAQMVNKRLGWADPLEPLVNPDKYLSGPNKGNLL